MRTRQPYLLTVPCLLALALVVSVIPAKGAAIYNAVDDFSASNPNGVWSYGYMVTLGGPFNLLTVFSPAASNNTNDIDAWAYSTNYPDGTATPYVGHNTLTTTDTFFNLPPDLLQMHPGDPTAADPHPYAVVRWTAPALIVTTVQVSGLFSTMFNGQATTDVHILVDGVEVTLPSNIFSGTGAEIPFNFSANVSPGSTIDFVVGPNGNYNGDSTGLAATINTVPEPATRWTLLLPFAAWLAYRVGSRKRGSVQG